MHAQYNDSVLKPGLEDINHSHCECITFSCVHQHKRPHRPTLDSIFNTLAIHLWVIWRAVALFKPS